MMSERAYTPTDPVAKFSVASADAVCGPGKQPPGKPQNPAPALLFELATMLVALNNPSVVGLE
jgi:hypothetical protein